MSDVSIYALAEPDSGTVRYVGKARDAQARLRQHLADSQLVGTHPRVCWLRSLKAAGKTPLLLILETCTLETWEQAERAWIKRYMEQGAQLTNIAPGGGGSRSYRQRIAASVAKMRSRKNRPPAAKGTGVALAALRQYREYAALTQGGLAELAGVSRATISDAEQGEHISMRNLRKIATALGVAPEVLIKQPGQEQEQASNTEAGRVPAHVR